MSAIESLSEHHRQTVSLRYFEGMSPERIADATGVSLGTVKSRLHHAKRKLARRLGMYRFE